MYYLYTDGSCFPKDLNFYITKHCSECKLYKLLIYFHKNNKNISHYCLSYRCKQCDLKRFHEWKRKNPDKLKAMKRKDYIKNRYSYLAYRFKRQGCNFTAKDIQEAFIKANYKCAICSLTTTLCVDHCHKTKKLRNILCNNCNLIVGHCFENIDRLNKIIQYIKEQC